MYGKAFESMYEGSMYGAGVAVFAVWGYVIAKTHHSHIELNPKKLADTLGGTPEQIQTAIDYLCRPDPASRNKTHQGRRLVKEGAFQFFVTGFEEYSRMRNEEERREYNRLAKQKERAKKQTQKPLRGEKDTIRAVNDGSLTQEEADDRAAETRENPENEQPAYDPFTDPDRAEFPPE